MSGMKKSRSLTWFAMLALLAASFLSAFYNVPMATSQEATIRVKAIRGPIPAVDPESKAWSEALTVEVPLSPQMAAKPFLTSPSVRSLTVRSLTNGTWVAFLLEWKDSTSNMRTVKINEYRDAAAIQFPLGGVEASQCMGQLGTRVNILHWKADWQEDINTIFQDVEKAYPNLWSNYYLEAVGGPPYTVPPNADKTFLAGWAAGNPLSDRVRLTPVEDLGAEGFGTLTTQKHQNALGRGVWRDGGWKVVFSRPMVTGDPNDAELLPGQRKPVAFAVWDGANGEVNGRKSISFWFILRIEGMDVEQGPFTNLSAVALPAAVGLSLAALMIGFMARTRKG